MRYIAYYENAGALIFDFDGTILPAAVVDNCEPPEQLLRKLEIARDGDKVTSIVRGGKVVWER